MKHNSTWGGVATPEVLAKCLDYVFTCARVAADWLADLRSAKPEGSEMRKQAISVRDSFEDAILKWRATNEALTEINGSAPHPAEAATACSAIAVDDARKGAIEPSKFIAEWAIANFAKKFRFGCRMSDEEAKQKFLERNSRCANNLRWDIRLRMRQLLESALPPVKVEEGRFGPGATFEKANVWPKKVELCALLRGHYRVFAWDAEALEVAPRVAKLHAVPKDFKRKRLITVEPLVVAWHQQAARSTMLASVHSGSLKGTIMDQSLSQTYEAVPGVAVSRNRIVDPVLRQRGLSSQGALSGRLVTIDLSDASDTISWEAVQSVFPAWILALLEKCRSTAVWDGRNTHTLRMYAGMGNATTFIVETLFFWALFTAVGESTHCGKPQVSVFGDDIVMNGKVARNQWFQGMIRESGLLINWDKSGLSAGPGFREACGSVDYHGVHVPFTPRFYGYAGTREGAVQYCELTSRLLNSHLLEFKLLGLGLYTWEGAPKAPLLNVRDIDETGAVMAYCVEEWSDDPNQDVLSLLRHLLPGSEKARIRYNPFLQRNEAYLYACRAKTASCTLRDPIWGPGVTRSWGWWAYKLALLGQTTHDVRVTRKSRVIRYAVSHRNTIRRRWVPVGFLNPVGE